MATAQTLVTAEDLLRPGNPYDRGELWDGAWVVRDPSGGWAEVVTVQVLIPLGLFVRQGDLGWVTASNQGFYVRRNPDRVLSPEAAFISYARLPMPPARGFIECAPDFVVEVVSPEDTWDEQVAKAGVWVGHGSLVAWVADPKTKRVAIVRPGRPMQILQSEGFADASPALPDFRLALSEIFARIP